MPSEIAKRFESIIEPVWDKTINGLRTGQGEPRLFHRYEVTPPFPSLWPPCRESFLYYYLYGNGSGHHFDADEVGTIWGRIEVAFGTDARPKFVRMADEIRQLGVQGCWPLKKEEIEIYRTAESVESFLKELTESPDEKSEIAEMTRKYYDLWMRCHGVLEREVRPRHEEFFRWVASGNNSAAKLKKRWWQWWK